MRIPCDRHEQRGNRHAGDAERNFRASRRTDHIQFNLAEDRADLQGIAQRGIPVSDTLDAECLAKEIAECVLKQSI